MLSVLFALILLMNNLSVNIDLQPKQMEALRYCEESDSQYFMYGGAKGGGKSYLARAKEIIRRMKYSGTTGVIIRKTHPELLANHIRKMQVEFPFINAWYRSGEKAIYYPNGSVTEFKYLDSTNDVYNFQGIEYDDISLDEATQHEEEVFKILKTSLRTDPRVKEMHPDYKPKMMLTGNPGGIGHAWVQRLFVDRDFDTNENPRDYHFIQAFIWDNPIFLEANPQYLQNLEDLPEDLRRAYLEGDWNIFAGQFFKKLRAERHLMEPVDLHPQWVRFRAIDWGYNHPTVCVWAAVDYDNNIYIYRTYKEKEITTERTAKNILALTKPDENVVSTVAGHDLWARIKTDEKSTDKTIADQMARNGLYLTRAVTDRIHGWNALREVLEWNENKPEPQLRIFNTPDNLKLFGGLKRLIHDDLKKEDVKKMDGDDEGDTVRYLIMHIFKTRRPERQKGRVEQLIDKLNRESSKKRRAKVAWGANL